MKWKYVGTTWKPSSLAYTTFLCHHLLPRHQLPSIFHVPFQPHALVAAPFKVCPLKFDRRVVTLKWLVLAYCTFVSERQGTFLNCGVFSLSYFEGGKTLSYCDLLRWRVLFHPTHFSVLAYFSQNATHLMLVRLNNTFTSKLQIVRSPSTAFLIIIISCHCLVCLPLLYKRVKDFNVYERCWFT